MKKTTIKHITLSLLLIIATGGAVLGLSRAFFQDQETVNPTMSMGVLNLQVGEEDPANVPLDFTGMAPEQVRSYTFDVKNIGNVPGELSVQAFITHESEGENYEPEPVTVFDGDISQCAHLSLVMTDLNGDDVILIDHELIRFTHQETYGTEFNSLLDQAINQAHSEATITIDTNGCGSETMGDLLEMELVFTLIQMTV